MHESSFVLRLLRRIEQEGRAAGAVRISAVRVRVGECAGVSAGPLLRAFEQLARGTMAQGALLRIERAALESLCETCGCRFRVIGFRFECPACGGRRTRVVGGEEIVLESLTVVTECDMSLTWIH